MINLKSEIVKGFATTSFFGVITKLITVLVTLYCSNMLAPDEFGEFGYLKNTLDIIIMICAANFTSLAIKFAAESMTSEKSLRRLYILVFFTLSVSFLATLIITIIPSGTLDVFFDNSSITHYIKVLGLLLPIFIVYPLVCAILRGYKEFTIVGAYETSVSTVYLLLIIVGVYLFKGKGAIYALFSFHFIASLVGVLIVYHYNKHKSYLIKVSSIESENKCAISMILPVFLMSFIEAPLQWLGQTEVAKNGSYALVGCLTVIVQVRYVIQMLPSFFYSSFTSFVSILNAQRRHQEYFGKFTRLFKILVLMSVVLVSLLVLFGKFILGLFNDIYIEYYNSYLLSLLSVPLLLLAAMYKLNMMVKEHQRGMLYMSIICSLLFILFLYAFIALGLNVLDAFFLAQFVQFGSQCLIGWTFFSRDKKTVYK